MMKSRLVTFGLMPLLALLMGLFCPGRVSADQWFRGNTHTHTTVSDGDAAPEAVAKWYHDRDYNFLVISDHNKFVDPETVKLPDNRRKDFLLIPGEEISGPRAIHTTAMNINKLASWKYHDEVRSKVIQFHVDEAINAGGTPIFNHPNFRYAVSAEDILPVRRLHMFELFNGHPSVNNNGDETHLSTEAIWDQLLTKGMKMFAVAADDAHHYHDVSLEKANPGRGWVMVRAAELDAAMITKAMLQGDFYASTGVFLKTYERGPGTYSIEVDAAKTKQELAALPLPISKHVENAKEGFRIEFIGPEGKILETIKGEKGSFKISKSIPYVRAKVIFTRRSPEKDGFEEFYVWGQPVFNGAKR